MGEKMKKFYSLLLALTAALIFNGCLSFYDCKVMPGDEKNDDANMSFVALDRKNYEERLKFKRPIVIKMSEKGHRFLQAGFSRGTSRLRLTPTLRRSLMATVDSTLVNIVSKLRDFEVVGSEASLNNTTGVTVTRIPPANSNTPAGPYLLTFNINNVEMRDANDTIRGLVGIADIAMGASGVSHKVRRNVRRANEIHWYYAVVTLEVTLTSPAGKAIFNFSDSVIYGEKLPSAYPNESTLKQAVANAVTKAMKQYVLQFGPPLYVDQTVGNGLFARLSAGSEYGIYAGQKVRFFRRTMRKVPTLPGEPEKFEAGKIIVGEGYVGRKDAPVDKDHAWVYIPGNDDPAQRSVFTWTSAEIVK